MRTQANGHALNGRTTGGHQTNGQPQADQYGAAAYDDAGAYQSDDAGAYQDDADPARYQASPPRGQHQLSPATSGYGLERPTREYGWTHRTGSPSQDRRQAAGSGREPAQDITGNGYRDQDAAQPFRAAAPQELSWSPAWELDLDDPSRTPPPPPLRTSTQVQPADRQQAGWTSLGAPDPAQLQSLPPAAVGPRLRVDWPHCKAHGLCHELLPEAVRLDEWGYPIIGDQPLPPKVLDDARRAVMACPTLALHLVE
jgi:ferredoxin